MTPRRRAILILGLILILISIIIGVILMLSRAVTPQEEATPPTESPTDVFEPPQIPSPEFENPLLLPAPAEERATESRQIAELFAERYGSYSNQGDYQNLRDLLPVMTPGYRAETEAFLADADAAPAPAYEGVTSKKVSTEVRAADADSAVIAVSLQQEKTSGSTAPTVGYRTLRMELMLIGDEWRVDAASWEN